MIPDQSKLVTALSYAVEEVGYRHIDTAFNYGSEGTIGSTLARIFAEGKIKREDLFITTKLPQYHHRPAMVEKSLRESLRRLQLDYVDLYLVHWPHAEEPDEGDWTKPKRGPDGKAVPEHVDILDVWGAMEEVQRKGLAKRIGVSNFSIEMLERMEYSGRVTIQPFTNQVELNVYCQQGALIAYLERRGIALTAYSPLGKGRVGPYGTTVPNDAVLAAVAEEVGRTPAQVALRFLLQLSPVVHVLAKSITLSRVKENFDLDFELSEAQMGTLKKRNLMDRGIDPFAGGWGADVLGLGH